MFKLLPRILPTPTLRCVPRPCHFSSSSVSLTSRFSALVNNVQQSMLIENITPRALHERLQQLPTNSDKLPVVLDVRETSEHNVGVIPHSILLPRGILERDVEKFISVESDRPIVLYCAGGLRSILAAEGLIRLGYKKERILSLEEGFNGWRKEGFDIEMPNKKE